MRAFGRPGDGPGEFRSPDGLAVMRDGRVVIADIGHRAYHLFDAAGEFERRIRMPSEPGNLRLTELLPDPGGQAVFSAVGGQVPGMVFGGSVRTTPHTTRPVERVMLMAEVAAKDTVAEGWLPDGDPRSFPVGNQRTLDLPSQKTFGPLMLAGVLPDGSVAFSDSSAYVVKIARQGEGVWRILKRPLQPIPVTNRVIEAEKQRQLMNASGGGSVLNGVRESPQGSRRRALERIEARLSDGRLVVGQWGAPAKVLEPGPAGYTFAGPLVQDRATEALVIVDMCAAQDRLFVHSANLGFDELVIHEVSTVDGTVLSSFADAYRATFASDRQRRSYGSVACAGEPATIVWGFYYFPIVKAYQPDNTLLWTALIEDFTQGPVYQNEPSTPTVHPRGFPTEYIADAPTSSTRRPATAASSATACRGLPGSGVQPTWPPGPSPIRGWKCGPCRVWFLDDRHAPPVFTIILYCRTTLRSVGVSHSSTVHETGATMKAINTTPPARLAGGNQE